MYGKLQQGSMARRAPTETTEYAENMEKATSLNSVSCFRMFRVFRGLRVCKRGFPMRTKVVPNTYSGIARFHLPKLRRKPIINRLTGGFSFARKCLGNFYRFLLRRQYA